MKTFKLLLITLFAILTSCSSDDDAGVDFSEGSGGSEFLTGKWQLANIIFEDFGSDIEECEKSSTLEFNETEATYVSVFQIDDEGTCSEGSTRSSSFTVNENRLQSSALPGIFDEDTTTFTATENSLRIIGEDTFLEIDDLDDLDNQKEVTEKVVYIFNKI